MKQGSQGRGPTFGGRDVRGFQPQTQSQVGFAQGGYNAYNRNQNQNQQGPRMPSQGQGQYKQYGDGYQQQQQYQSQGQGGYPQHNNNMQNQHQQPFMQRQQPQPNGHRYGQQDSDAQYGQQVGTYGSMVPPASGSIGPQNAYYENNYAMVYTPPGGVATVAADGSVTSQMNQMSMGHPQAQGHQRGHYSADGQSEQIPSYIPTTAAASADVATRTPAIQGVPYQQQGYMQAPVSGGQYDQGGYNNSPQGHQNGMYNQGQGQGQQNQYGGGRYGGGARGGRGMGGRVLNGDARPYNVYGNGQGRGQGQGQMMEYPVHQGGGMVGTGYGNSNYTYAQQPAPAYSSTNSNAVAGNNGHNLQGMQSESYSTAQNQAQGGAKGGPDGGFIPPSGSTIDSNQQKSSDAVTSA